MTRQDAVGAQGILAPVRFGPTLQVVLLVLQVVCAVRYVLRHHDGAATPLVLGLAGLLAMLAAGQAAVPRRDPWPVGWTLVASAVWAALTLIAPSFAWCAVPLAFSVLHLVPFIPACGVVAAMTGVVIVAQVRLATMPDPTVFAGPAGIAVATVVAYRALDREARARQRLLDELTATQADLAAAQHRAGALAERARLSREIHDSIGQSLSSINLLLQAAEQGWQRRPDTAREQMGTAAGIARTGLDEVRRVVRDLAPSELDGAAGSLPAALERLVADAARQGLAAELRLHGEAGEVPLPVASALIRTVRGALANVAEHARAHRVVVSLTAQPDELRLDVRDDGIGFDARPAALQELVRQRAGVGRGRGLAGIGERVAALGGMLSIESVPGEGTTLSVAFPVGPEIKEAAP